MRAQYEQMIPRSLRRASYHEQHTDGYDSNPHATHEGLVALREELARNLRLDRIRESIKRG